jgi:hypothetical protein
VSSVALEEWRGASSRSLDEIESLHRLAEASSQSGPELKQQIVYAYATQTLAHFQRYCRAVHSEATGVLAGAVAPPGLEEVTRILFVRNRFLDRGNPTPASLGSDFARFGFRLWPELEAVDRSNLRRREELGQLCEWRNGITHGDIAPKRAAGRLIPRMAPVTRSPGLLDRWGDGKALPDSRMRETLVIASSHGRLQAEN